jgi:hypothetical protein
VLKLTGRFDLIGFSVRGLPLSFRTEKVPHVEIVVFQIFLYLGSGQKLSGNPVA